MYLLGCSTGPKAMHPKPASAGMHGAPRYPLLRPRSGVAGGTTAASKGWMLVSAERLRGTRRVEDAQGWASFN